MLSSIGAQQFQSDTIDAPKPHRSEVDLRVSVLGFKNSYYLTGQRRADKDQFALPLDLAVAAHPAQLVVGGIVGIFKAGRIAPRRGRVMARRRSLAERFVSVLYPTAGLAVGYIAEDEIRRACCRAFNMYAAHQFGEFSDRMTPAAAIPMHTPEEATAELEYVVKELGLKVVVMTSIVPRPIPAIERSSPGNGGIATWPDVFGIDSPYNYDPVWSKCVELGVVPTFHAGTRGAAFRTSPTNFVYNHIGHFAVAGEAVAKGLFLGGITRRFPTLKFAFLEGGVGWACSLYSDLIGHWKKRNRHALEEVNPANLDRKLMRELFERFGGKQLAERLDQSAIFDGLGATGTGNVKNLDDFSACNIERAEDIRELFTRNFYFGCEADDPINAWAFNSRTNPCRARIRTLLGSDIGHFDVVNMNEVLEEAYELVEGGLITDQDFREFVFTNPLHFWADGNPDFFKGTVLESDAAGALATSSSSS